MLKAKHDFGDWLVKPIEEIAGKRVKWRCGCVPVKGVSFKSHEVYKFGTEVRVDVYGSQASKEKFRVTFPMEYDTAAKAERYIESAIEMLSTALGCTVLTLFKSRLYKDFADAIELGDIDTTQRENGEDK